MRQAQSLRGQSPGFSLVEVTIALAVMAFVCASLIGMIPMAVNSFHQALNNNVEAAIVQDLNNDIQLANFSDLNQYAQQTYCFDNEGVQLATGVGGSFPTGTVYTATVAYYGVNVAPPYPPPAPPTPSAPSPPAVPALTSAPLGSPSTASAYNLVITVTNQKKMVTDTLGTHLESHYYPLVVANNGQ